MFTIGDVLEFKAMPKKPEPKKWCGTLPKTCDLCHVPLTEGFVDGATIHGPWANMCPRCFAEFGIGLGVGRGQQYDQTGLKIAG